MDPTVTLVVSILENLFCLVGIFSQTLLCSILIKYRKTTFSNPFYKFVIILSIADLLHLFSETMCALPAVLYGLEGTSKLFLYSCGYVANVSFWYVTPLMLIIAVNRYTAVCHYKSYGRVFTNRLVNLLIGGTVIGGFAIPTMMYSCHCYYDFRNAWTFTCNFNGTCANVALNLNSVVANSVCVLIVLIYLRIFVQYRSIRKAHLSISGGGGHHQQQSPSVTSIDFDRRRKARETVLMIQFSLISVVLIANQIFFWIFSKVLKNEPGEMGMNFLRNLNSSISAFLYLAFGSEIKRRLPWRRRKEAEGNDGGGGGPVRISPIATISKVRPMMVPVN